MQPEIKHFKLRKPVQRENAARYLLISLLSFIATVTVVRSFLVFTGYPQIGSGTLHIAHVLWGGLILYIAAILPLMYLNPRINSVSAVLSGVGVGLFIDEVGKFITRQYDYFYPAAAPIMYVFFLLVLIILIMINRPTEIDGRAELLQALATVQQQLYRPLEKSEKARFEKEIGVVMEIDTNSLHVELARHLLEFIRSDARTIPESAPAWWLRGVLQIEAWMSEFRLRRLLEAGLILSGLLALKNPLQVFLIRTIPDSFIVSLLGSHLGRQIDAVDAPTLFNVRLSLEVMVGVLLLASAGLMFLGKRRQAINLGFFSLLASMAVLDLLLFYFEQFSAVLIVAFQLMVFFGVMYYRRKYLRSAVDKLDIQI